MMTFRIIGLSSLEFWKCLDGKKLISVQGNSDAGPYTFILGVTYQSKYDQ